MYINTHNHANNTRFQHFCCGVISPIRFCRCDSGSSNNPCISKDSKAKCTDITGDGYKCTCSTKQYSGKNCEKSWCDPGSSNNPCISKDSKAKCTDIAGDGYKCTCSSSQYSGKNCEESWCVVVSNVILR